MAVRAAVAVAVMAGWAAAPASADGWRVSVTSSPWVSGSAHVGSTLTAGGGAWSGPRHTVAGYAWMRCRTSDPDSCAMIHGAESTATYRLGSDDQSYRIRAVRWAVYGYDFAYRYSNPTAVVTAAPAPTPTPTRTPTPTPTPTRTPTPTPTRTPTPTPTPTRTPVPTPTRTPAPAPIAAPVVAPAPAAAAAPLVAAKPAKRHTRRRLRMLRPYPLVRISGRLTATGAYVRRLTVRAPRGARITVVCRGRDCPRRRVARTASVRHLWVFQRNLRAGTRLTVKVAKRGFITKVTTIRIRRGRPPARTDLCVTPGRHHRRAACPTR